MVLENGSVRFIGTVNDAVDHYIGFSSSDTPLQLTFKGGQVHKDIEFLSVRFAHDKNSFASNEPIEFIFKIKAHRDVPNFRINTSVFGMDEVAVGSVSNTESLAIHDGETKEVSFQLCDHHLASGQYSIAFSLGIGNYLTAQRDFDYISNQLCFSIEEADKNHRQESVIAQWDAGWGHIMFNAKMSYL